MKKLMGNLNEMIWERVRKINAEDLIKIEKELEVKFPEEDKPYLINLNLGKASNIVFKIDGEEFKL